MILQGSAKRWFPGCENFVPSLAYHFCLDLPAEFSQPGKRLFVGPCTQVCTSLLSSQNARKDGVVHSTGRVPGLAVGRTDLKRRKIQGV